MPGNRAIFDRAMEGHRDAAQREDWPQAFRDALRAVQELPSDLDARTALAISLYHTGKYAQATQLLEELRKRRGDDPLMQAYLARAYEGAGQIELAVPILLEIAEQALTQRRLPDVVEAFEEVIRLEPAREDVRIRWAEVLVEMGEQRAAAEQCLEVARTREAQGNDTGALEALDEAIGLDGSYRPAQVLWAHITERLAAAAGQLPDAGPPSVTTGTKEHGTADAPRRGTGGMRATGGLRRVTGSLPDAASAGELMVATALQQQAAGSFSAARTTYEQLVGQGIARNDVFYNLGLVYAELGEHKQAIDVLRRVSASDEYALSAYFALGQSLRALGETRAAAEQFEATIHLVDLETINRAEADDLVAMYEAAGECYTELGEMSRAASLYGTLAAFLLGKRWGKELGDQFKQRAKDLTERSMFAKLRSIGTGALPGEQGPDLPVSEAAAPPASEVWGSLPSLSDFLKADSTPPTIPEQAPATADVFTLPDVPVAAHTSLAPVTPISTAGCPEIVVRMVAASGRFAEQGLIYAALDACHEVIRLAPDFLPIHLRLGEIYERDGRQDEAAAKYRTLIETYAVRDQQRDAIDVYYRLIELSSDTIATRTTLADLLRQAGRVGEAASQALLLANTYFKIGQTNRALEEFRQMQQWAPRSSVMHKEYGQALFKLDRWEAALQEFRRAAQLEPSDPVALAQLNMTFAVLGQHERALWDSFASVLQQLRTKPQAIPDVQAAYRSALLIVDSPVLHYLLGVVQQAADQHASATLSFEQALALLVMEEQQQLPVLLVHQALAESYSAQGQAQAAIDQLYTAQRLFSEHPIVATVPYLFARPLTEAEVERRLAAALATVGDWQAAINALDHCLKLDPTDFAAYTQLADIYFRQGNLPQALVQYQQLATVYETRQQLDQAIATLEDAVKLAPSAMEIRSRLAQMLIRRGRLEPGLKELQEVALLQKQAGQTKDAVLSLQQAAEVYWMLGQHDSVFRVYQQIIKMAPTDLDARQQLVNLHILAGQRDAAIAEQRNIAEICQGQEHYNEAIAALHQIIALDPADAPTYEHLGDLLLRVKEYDQAVRLFRRLARLRPGDAHIEALQSAAERMFTLQREQPQAA